MLTPPGSLALYLQCGYFPPAPCAQPAPGRHIPCCLLGARCWSKHDPLGHPQPPRPRSSTTSLLAALSDVAFVASSARLQSRGFGKRSQPRCHLSCTHLLAFLTQRASGLFQRNTRRGGAPGESAPAALSALQPELPRRGPLPWVLSIIASLQGTAWEISAAFP